MTSTGSVPDRDLERARALPGDDALATAKPRDAERKEAGAKYRGLLEAAPDAMIVVDQAGYIVLLNLQAEKQFGYRRNELVGQPVTNIIPGGFAERLLADDLRSAEDALAQRIGTGIELTGLRKDGTEFPIEIMLSPLQSADGLLVTAAIRDVSVRKAATQIDLVFARIADGPTEAGSGQFVLGEEVGRSGAHRCGIDGRVVGSGEQQHGGVVASDLQLVHQPDPIGGTEVVIDQ